MNRTRRVLVDGDADWTAFQEYFGDFTTATGGSEAVDFTDAFIRLPGSVTTSQVTLWELTDPAVLAPAIGLVSIGPASQAQQDFFAAYTAPPSFNQVFAGFAGDVFLFEGAASDVGTFGSSGWAYGPSFEAGFSDELVIDWGSTQLVFDSQQFFLTEKGGEFAFRIGTIVFDTHVHEMPEAFSANLASFESAVFKAAGVEFAGSIDGDLIDGTFSADILRGRDGNDSIVAYGGDDLLEGNEGNDGLNGGDGADQIDGGAGDDSIFGGGGVDLLEGGDGNDNISAGDGDDQVFGGAGNDRVSVGGTGNVTVELGTGSDLLTVSTIGDTSGVITLTDLFPEDALQVFGFSITTRVIQRGADAVIQFDPAGGAVEFQDLVVIRNAAGVELRYNAAGGFYFIGGSATATAGNDTLLGDGNANALNGLAGNDRIYGEGGNDTLEGGAGNDVLSGGAGDDTYRVDASDVVLEYADAGNDKVLVSATYVLAAGISVEALATTSGAGTAAINLTGNELANAILGNAGNNLLAGGGGNDVLNGNGGTDSLNGGAGDDQAYVDSAGDVVVEGAGGGNDRVLASVTYALGAGAEVETLSTTNAAGTAAIDLTGNGFANSLLGNAGNNVLNGGGGNDILSGLGGTDTFVGGAGDDQIYVDSAADVVVEGAGGGNDRVLTTVSFTLLAGVQVETLSTTNAAGTAAINLLGNEFANALLGNAGANTLNGGAGADVLSGFAGNDLYYVDNAADQVYELAGNGTDRIFASAGYTLRGGSFVETISTTDVAGTAAINLGGNETANALLGNAGNNILNGGAGADTLSGYGGNDNYYVDTAADLVLEAAGGGTDRIFASASYTLRAGVQVETISTTNVALATAINLAGNELANIVYGNAGANILNGGGGADILSGFGGNDQYYVDTAGDQVFEAAGGGNDRIFASASFALAAGAEVEELTTASNAGTTAIDLTGNELANKVLGNAGNNVLNGGAGSDSLQGLGGADAFAFTTALGASNVDVVADFASAQGDRIRLDNAVFAGLADGALPANAFVIGTAAADADDRIIYNSATGALLFDADGVGGAAAVQFATLNGAPALAAGDFLVI